MKDKRHMSQFLEKGADFKLVFSRGVFGFKALCQPLHGIVQFQCVLHDIDIQTKKKDERGLIFLHKWAIFEDFL